MPTPRLLLFGSPGAGKTSLLGALAQAAAAKGTLVDRSGVWGRLKQSTYEAPTPTTDKLATYDFKLQAADSGAAITDVRITDCGGKSAVEMLKAKSPFADSHHLKKPILGADAILLLVDLSQPAKIADEFRQFGNWLAELRETRSRRIDVGDLPVYVILTKCDALARPDDNFGKWAERIEDAKRKVNEQFHKVFDDEGEGFGSLEITFWATAIKRPALSDAPARPLEPYGVAELFRECIGAASDFARRRQSSQVRVYNLVVGLASAIAILGLALAFLFDFQPGAQAVELEQQLQSVLPRADAKAAQRLAGTQKRLEDKRRRLADIEAAPEFSHLPGETRDSVQKYRQEVEQYLKLADDFKTKVKFPWMAKTEQEFFAQEKALKALTCPPEWDDTPIGKRVKQCRGEYGAVHKAIDERTSWYAEQTKKNDALLDQGAELQLKVRRKAKLAPQEAERWDVQYRAQMQARPPALQSDPIPGVSGVTYEFLDKFQSIKDARKRADSVKTQLRRVAENIQDELKGT